MEKNKYNRIPKHIAIIPDGNRRWAVNNNMEKHAGYDYGVGVGLEAFDILKELGVEEVTFFGFTQDNTKRPKEQYDAFSKACVDAVKSLESRDAEILVVGNKESNMFPKELLPYTERVTFNKGGIKVNHLVNYGWYWDMKCAYDNPSSNENILENIGSAGISRIDVVMRWGGRHRLSGMLPIQTVYADTYIIDDMWPDFKPEHIYNCLDWYQGQDVTLGG